MSQQSNNGNRAVGAQRNSLPFTVLEEARFD